MSSEFDNQKSGSEMNRIKRWIWAPVFWGLVCCLILVVLQRLVPGIIGAGPGVSASTVVLAAGAVVITGLGTLLPVGRRIAEKAFRLTHWLIP